MRMRIGATTGCIGAIVLGMACGPDPIAQEELEEVCGEDGPFRVLEIDPDQQLSSWPLRVGDRRVFMVNRAAQDGVGSFPEVIDSQVWSTGLCGESPVQLADDLDQVFTIDRWPDVLLACKMATGEIFEVDPSGERAPHLVFTGDVERYGCALRWTDHGLLSVVGHGEDFGALMLSPYPDDPRTQTSAPVAVLDPVRITSTGRGGSNIVANSIRAFADSVLAIDGEDALVRVDLADRSVTTLQTGVREIEASRDGRYVMWQDMMVTREGDRALEGKVFLRELPDGQDELLGETALQYTMLALGYTQAGMVQLEFERSAQKKLFFLPGLQSMEVPTDLFFNGKLEDGRWLGGSMFDNFFELFDLQAGTKKRLFPRPTDLAWFEPDGLVVFETTKRCCVDGDMRDEGPLWRVPFDGEAKQIAPRGSRLTQPLPDGRSVGPVDVGEDWLGMLVVNDASTGEERRVDDHVAGHSLSTNWFEDEGLITYSVSDGERSGVYLARLPQQARSGVVKRTVREGFADDFVRRPDETPMAVPRVPGGLRAPGAE
ncbi:hypothetical protein OV090_23595 [Nannocystis sp. RBIL2]|uniref:hypothetical protein n=1 Tax=Nannocystis sp. RBIL2 TaxID=2996788 RepID=UPI002272220B|nr:hypothetical protein [Nannocystis sp. RBIL2]MCY1067749.1 hypothetical protein [Nannocystis sp. RBIL2]